MSTSDAVLRDAIREIVQARGTALSILDICESLHARGMVRLTSEIRLYPSEPTRRRVADLTLALCKEGAFATLGLPPPARLDALLGAAT
jgi:hypothetical protein